MESVTLEPAAVETIREWSEFAVALAGVGAVLAGLVFVALSVNLDKILRVAGLPARAGETLVIFIGAVLQSALLLIPGPNESGLGALLLVVGIAEWAVLLALFISSYRVPTRQPWLWHAVRIVVAQLATLPAILSGGLLIGGVDPNPALAGLAVAVLWAVVAGTANAWILVVEVVRDERYRPVEDDSADDPE